MADVSSTRRLSAPPPPTRLAASPAWFSFPALVAIALWAGSYVAAKFAFVELQPLTIAGLRMLLVAPCLFAIARLGGHGLAVDVRRDGHWLLIAALTMGGDLVLWAVGLDLTTAGNAVLLYSSSPVVTAFFAILLLGERPRPRRLAGILLSFFGIAIIVGGGVRVGGERQLLGDLLTVSAMMIWSPCSVVVTPLVHRYSLIVENAYLFALAGLLALPFVAGTIAGEPWGQLSLRTWLALGYAVFFATLFAYLLWHRGIRRLGSSQTMVHYYLQPILGLALAAAVLGESVTLNQLLGAAVVFAGIALTRRS